MAEAQKYISDLKEAVTDAVKVNYFQFDGRAARPAYWWCFLALFLAYFIVGLLNSSILSLVVSFGLLLPSLGIAVRRLHDINLSGWFVIAMMIPVIGWILAIYWGIKPGSADANDYGPAPANPNISTAGAS